MPDILDIIVRLLLKIGLPEKWMVFVSYALLSVFILLLCVILELFVKWVILGLAFRVTKNHRRPLFTFLKKQRFFQRVIHLISPLVINFFAPSFGKAENWISEVVKIYIIIMLIFIINSALSVVDDVYRTHEVSKKRPIKSFLQILEIIIVLVFGIVIIASWINESPIVLLSGIGAFTAVLSIIFKDTLLGFVAGIQLTTDDMIHIGDWIEMPKYEVEGTVSDISLISVRVENADNTTSTVPAYVLLSDSFKNYRSMKAAGARRIKRAIYIDMTSITFCSEDMLDAFSKIEYLNSYITEKKKNFEEYQSQQKTSHSSLSSRQKLTNIGVFRIYLERYLAANPKIREDMTLLVRQLPAESRGLPMEVYAFAAETEWVPFENLQSDIFDHIYAIAPSFGLRLFQEPTGRDMQRL